MKINWTKGCLEEDKESFNLIKLKLQIKNTILIGRKIA